MEPVTLVSFISGVGVIITGYFGYLSKTRADALKDELERRKLEESRYQIDVGRIDKFYEALAQKVQINEAKIDKLTQELADARGETTALKSIFHHTMERLEAVIELSELATIKTELRSLVQQLGEIMGAPIGQFEKMPFRRTEEIEG